MKNLLLAIALGALAYFAYHEWFGDPKPPQAASQPSAPVVSAGLPAEMAIVDPMSLMRVDRLFREWRRRNAGTQRKQFGVATVDMADEIASIKFNGPYTRRGIQGALAKALVSECGVDPGESMQIAAGILREADRDGSKGGHDRSN